MKRSVTKRTAERLIRLAYDLEALAARLGAEGFGDFARGVKAASSSLGNMGRDLRERLSDAD